MFLNVGCVIFLVWIVDMIIDCVKDYLRTVSDDIIIHCNMPGSILEVESLKNSGMIDRYQLQSCQFNFYNSFVRVGFVTSTTYRHVADIYYSDPDMLNIIRRWVCTILGLDC